MKYDSRPSPHFRAVKLTHELEKLESPIEMFRSSIRELNGATEESTRQNNQINHGLELQSSQSRYFQDLNNGTALNIPSSLAIGSAHSKSLETHLLSSR